MRELRNTINLLSIELDDADRRFMVYESRLENKIKARLIQKLECIGQKYWDYDVGGVTTVLNSDIFAGVSVHVEDRSHEGLLKDVAERISRE